MTHTTKIKGLGKTRPERMARKARRMWKFYQSNGGWWQFTWPGFVMWESENRAAK